MTTPPQQDAGQTVEQVPVCPRHPDRVSYVRCQRCERPVCPECQRPAAVGVQCVDCVREQSRGVRSARTVFGGAVGTGRPVVTQDTGWSKHLPEGEGLLAFEDVEGAAEALKRVESDPARHSRAARAVAEEHFDSARVLAALLAETGA